MKFFYIAVLSFTLLGCSGAEQRRMQTLEKTVEAQKEIISKLEQIVSLHQEEMVITESSLRMSRDINTTNDEIISTLKETIKYKDETIETWRRGALSCGKWVSIYNRILV